MAPEESEDFTGDFPVPFSVDDLPEELQSVVRPGIREASSRDAAYHAIEEYWEDGGERTAPTLLAYAFMRFTEACEIVVDRQLEEAERALELCAEAKERGVEKPGLVGAFERLCEETIGDQQAQRDVWYMFGDMPPEDVSEDNLPLVAQELVRRGEHERAIPFFERELECETRSAGSVVCSIANCHRKLGREQRADELYRQVIDDQDEYNDENVARAYRQWVLMAPDEQFRSRFDEAREWAARTNQPWLRNHDTQEKLLDRGLRIDDEAVVTAAAEAISNRDASVRRDLRQKTERALEQYRSD